MSFVITYFDFNGSRGLECRLAAAAAGLAFEDRRLSRAEWAALKPTTPFGAMPFLEHDGRIISQSNAILRYIGVTHAMHPSDPWTAAEHDALMASVEDIRHKLPGAGLSDEQKRAARVAFAADWLSQWASTVAARIRGPFVEGATLHVVDIKLYVILRAFFSDTYDHLPGTFFDAYPAIGQLYAAVDRHPAIAGYFAQR